ncbi:putative DD41D transposase [Trichonephila clavipes]|nr:putative DD41D transposase [Trichonephila clavipes]
MLYLNFLKPVYDQARRRFVEWAQNEIAVVPDFHKLILFRDEAHFWWNGYVNKQNCRIWSESNPQMYVETPLHPENLTVWCALWAGGIISPYFFKTMKATTLQSMVIDKPQALNHLEDNIHRVIDDIRPQMLEKVIENWTSRLDYIGASRGSPMPEIIFKL